jgi:unsaturated rhamnogalacturonyl hydrolase
MIVCKDKNRSPTRRSTSYLNSFPVMRFLYLVAGGSLIWIASSRPVLAQEPAASTMTRQQLIAEGEKMADAQLTQLNGERKIAIDWVAGVMWAGYADFSHVSSKRDYAAAIERVGEQFQWKPILRPKNPMHADDLCIAQAFLDAYVALPSPAKLAASQSRFDAVCNAIDQGTNKDGPPKTDRSELIWWWSDALFMAPPSMSRLSAITHDPKYLRAMDAEWAQTADLLYDKEEHLFYRDSRFFNDKTANGHKVFWTRANGWVFAGLARTLRFMPRDFANRARYETIFNDMAVKLASLQQPDGTWYPSLLDAAQYPDPETSGTALDCFAFAWGINNGLLDRATYLPVVEKAWSALLAARRPDGLLGYVQGVADRPKPVKADGTQLYATGAFLMDVCELADLAPLTVPAPPKLSIPNQGKAK